MSELAVHPPVLVMGVSGSGKSTIGQALTDALVAQGEPCVFVDADDLHPAANKEKMRQGIPLTDEDRWPWIDACAERIAAVESGGSRCVMANSALKRAYRDRLRESAPGLVIAFLDGSRDLIAERQSHRQHEYMPTTLLDSQFATLERPQHDEAAVAVSIDGSVDDTVQEILAALAVTTD
ncbi:gluconokinase [Curtobacterium flaccumfaciens]|uniref:gluconokinase n=1 Tax=Curtobacterium flaccumfaciens TaxID=2035 RepID=UPI001BDDFD51|nr:gluconokinase [Curtobacterium flaccumfaciens]MBT1606560.1 gluconokinase [Curtobacterium flaccumfaciens pv. betae]MBT1658026.1 gluconokinase [Curtobacterium flaccumfaciens pv. betae]MCS0471394.1 gluconokinase [Curtobacterium flaccumfaciens pv. betae]MCS0476057.1 gluconokinase [Curtobacterium flaccumfaciens pv. betae]MCS0477475.1 gluconokinase [Curtobacterium flaccumfaciens pv. betae]